MRLDFSQCAISLVTMFSLLGCGETSTGGDPKTEGCDAGGKHYGVGDAFPSSDGCNTCSCQADGQVSCTLKACLSCQDITTQYADVMDRAKTCDPSKPNQCTARVTEGLTCGCDTFVNPANWDATAAQAWASQYASAKCGEGVVCGPCNTAVSGSCSAKGECVTNSDPTGGTACRVGNVTYPNGAEHVPDPTSCNDCTCKDGQLECTEKSCPMPCPEGTARGTQCFQCGPTDACEVSETGCFPTCTDTCSAGLCVQGLCRNVCG